MNFALQESQKSKPILQELDFSDTKWKRENKFFN